jgi:hypothetical protein
MQKRAQNEKGPDESGPVGLEPDYCPSAGRAQATSFSSEQLSSSGRLSWLRSSSIDSP